MDSVRKQNNMAVPSSQQEPADEDCALSPRREKKGNKPEILDAPEKKVLNFKSRSPRSERGTNRIGCLTQQSGETLP